MISFRKLDGSAQYNEGGEFDGIEHQPHGELTVSAEELFVIVDNALYDAKSHNRNMVVVA